MTKSILTAPFIPISSSMASHRGAQGVIYADQLKRAGIDVTCNMSLELYHEDHNKFDEMYVYHGNDWSGHLNLFGGLIEFPHVDNFVNFSKFKGKVYSLIVDFPDYYEYVQHKINVMTSKGNRDKIDRRWFEVDWENIKRMITTAETVIPNNLKTYDKIAVGDSHGICMYRPGWMLNSVPFKTLHGAISQGLHTFLPENLRFEEIEYYFGNIDIRHHLMRQEDPEAATRQLVSDYFSAASSVLNSTGAKIIRLYEPLPIENVRRSIPKTGWYKNTPYFGTWEERNNIREIFIHEALLQEKLYNGIEFFRWSNVLKNELGELDFKYMERPKSIHLSREAYPHWDGREWNKLPPKYDIENFFNQ